MSIPDAVQRFAIPDQLRFEIDPAGRPQAVVQTQHAHARVSLYGGQVLAYRPAGAAHDLLFMSERADFRNGTALRGGIPICWPWFGPDPQAMGRPAHGFARIRQWQLLATESDDQGAVVLTLALPYQANAQSGWPYAADLELVIRIGTALELTLATVNRGSDPLTVSEALHCYFAVADIHQVRIPALSGRTYIDKLAAGTHKVQSAPFHGDQAVDRIYLDPPGRLSVDDLSGGRSIHIDLVGAQNLVVWNPWQEGAEQLADLGTDAYRHMLCVEAANTQDRSVVLSPGERHCLGMTCRLVD